MVIQTRNPQRFLKESDRNAKVHAKLLEPKRSSPETWLSIHKHMGGLDGTFQGNMGVIFGSF